MTSLDSVARLLKCESSNVSCIRPSRTVPGLSNSGASLPVSKLLGTQTLNFLVWIQHDNIVQLQQQEVSKTYHLNFRRPDWFPAMEGMNPEIQGQGQVPLCDLGFGPLSCFVTMKPFSCDYLAPIKTRIPRDGAVQNAWTNSSLEVSEVIEANDNQLPKAATSSKLETKQAGIQKKRTFPSPKGKKFLDDATSLQSFSSGGSSPSWSRKWNSPKAMPARTLAGYKPDASSWT